MCIRDREEDVRDISFVLQAMRGRPITAFQRTRTNVLSKFVTFGELLTLLGFVSTSWLLRVRKQNLAWLFFVTTWKNEGWSFLFFFVRQSWSRLPKKKGSNRNVRLRTGRKQPSMFFTLPWRPTVPIFVFRLSKTRAQRFEAKMFRLSLDPARRNFCHPL